MFDCVNKTKERERQRDRDRERERERENDNYQIDYYKVYSCEAVVVQLSSGLILWMYRDSKDKRSDLEEVEFSISKSL